MSVLRVVASVTANDEDTSTHLDSHADMCVVGRNALILHDFDRPVDVVGYDPQGQVASALRTVSAALAYTNPTSGETVILVVHQAIHMPRLSHNLLCPNQLRLNDVAVDERPKFLTEHPTENTHAIQVPAGDDNHPALTIRLEMRGIVSCFATYKPTAEEYESLPRYELTYESPVFDPSDPSFAEQEAACVDYRGHIVATGDVNQTRRVWCHNKCIPDVDGRLRT